MDAAPARKDFALPDPFAAWFARRGWRPREHQLAVTEAALRGDSVLLIAPTGGGKTLAGFLPSLIELHAATADLPKTRAHALHTLYISPLKALTQDVARNLMTPVEEMGLGLRIETRTGDTPASKRTRQRARPPDILLTTPEQLALFVAQENGAAFFADLKTVIIDEAHAIAPQKRGDLLALGLSAVERYAPGCRRIGLSATVHDADALARWLSRVDTETEAFPPPLAGKLAPNGSEGEDHVRRSIPPQSAFADSSPARGGAMSATSGIAIIRGAPGAEPIVDVLVSEERVPWSGHTGRHAYAEVYEKVKAAKTSLVFVNTRSQAEMTFQGLWNINDDNLAIALHHGSLAVEQRRKVEAAMTRGDLRAVVCTSTLDLGIDWGDVDLVINMGAPKGSARLIQRIGRANHRLDEPSRSLLVPSNRFEVLECRAAKDAVAANELDGDPLRAGSLDVLAQHVMGRACGDPFDPAALFDEIRTAAPYADLDWETFERVVDFVATGGYALRTYDRFARIVKGRDGLWRARTKEIAHRHRMNVGAIVEAAYLDVRLVAGGGHAARVRREAKAKGTQASPPPLRAGRMLGRVEEWFIEHLSPGDTFLFSGQVLRLESVVETAALVSRTADDAPKIPSWNGGKFPLSTFLAKGVRAMIDDPASWPRLPAQVREWLELQREKSAIPKPDELLVETFPRAKKFYLAAYPFEGRLAHQTLCMLLTRRLERLGRKPLGFVANDYAILIWAWETMRDVDLDALFSEDMLGDDLDAWLAESVMMKRTFKDCAQISGLIERRIPGAEKTGRQVTFSTDLIYDVLRRHQPDHIIVEAAWRDAEKGLLDLGRLADMLRRVKGRILHSAQYRVTPLAVPMMLEIGKVPIDGDASEALLAEVAGEDDLVKEAMG